MAEPQQDLVEQLVHLARELAGKESTEQTADALTRLAVQLVGGADEAGLSLLRARGRIETIGPTSALVAYADELQHDLEEGPCVEAVHEGEIDVPDLASDERWPRWRGAVLGEGVRSMFCVQLELGDRDIGALNLYALQPDAFSESDKVAARHLAGHAVVAIADVRERTTLRSALATRTVIGQAEGLLMERYQLDADGAFAVLTRFSQHSNVRLVDIAEKLVATRELPTIAP